MAAEAALRTGAGLVSAAVHPACAAQLNLGRPEIMVHGVTGAGALAPLLARASLVAIGPGLGQEAWGRELFAAVRDAALPLVLDADALNLLAADPQHREDWCLTPHPGEAARLLGCGTREIAQDRYAAAAALRARYGGVVVLKGAGSLVERADGTAVITDGNPGMASGGMGDVLTGVIAALAAQGLPLADAACAGAALHAAAADAAAVDGERGLLASDLFPHLRRLVN
jgi:NAD(P)H-hydrate epimerase